MITDVIERVELSAERERELIREAKETVHFQNSSVPSAAAQKAKETLIGAYASMINRMAKVEGLEWEEVEAALLEAFLRAIDDYDFQSGNRLAHEIRFRFTNAIAQVSRGKDALTISTRQKALFYQILYKDANGVWSVALDLAEKHPKMSRETMVAIAQALNVGPIADVETTLWNQGATASDYETVEFVNWLRDGLNNRERMVIDLHYGLDHDEASELRLVAGYGYNDDLSIPQVASVLNVHRQTAWRVHNEAINKMRSKVNAD